MLIYKTYTETCSRTNLSVLL